MAFDKAFNLQLCLISSTEQVLVNRKGIRATKESTTSSNGFPSAFELIVQIS